MAGYWINENTVVEHGPDWQTVTTYDDNGEFVKRETTTVRPGYWDVEHFAGEVETGVNEPA